MEGMNCDEVMQSFQMLYFLCTLNCPANLAENKSITEGEIKKCATCGLGMMQFLSDFNKVCLDEEPRSFDDILRDNFIM